MADVESVPLNLLQAEGPAELLSRIDELRNLGFHHRICLPQLVVCGRGGCGKTSVFQAITGIAFPVDHSISTRFAVEVAFRRSAEVSACVRIRPGSNASPEHKHKLRTFARPYNWIENVPALLEEARLLMGLDERNGYSLDVLQLEISGPSLPDLTAVDLPGILDSDDDCTAENIFLVKELTEIYMNNPRSIILAVVSADIPLAQHSVLQLVGSCASRTMGIITKLDTLNPDDDSLGAFYDRVRYQDSPLKLGWHVLKNIDTRLKDSFVLSRDDTESLFFCSAAPWRDLSPNAVGIDSLRDRLNKVLLGQVELQLSMLSSEIQKGLETHRSSLQKLGPESATIADYRLHITKIGDTVRRLTREAILGEYYDPYFRHNSNRSVKRLRSVVRRWADDFASDMRQRGHTYHIYDDTSMDILPASGFPDDPQPIPKSEYINEVLELLESSSVRGICGLANAQIVGELFVRFSSKWDRIAKAHVAEIWKKVKQFLDGLLHHVAGYGTSEAILREVINHGMEDRLHKINAKVDELLTPYRRIIPSTLNQQLISKISQIRRNSEKFGLTGTPRNMDVSLCNEVIDCMQAYYTVALDVFLDNVVGLAVENCLLYNIEDLLSPSQIAQMSDAQIERLTADSNEVKSSKIALARQVKVFEVAAAACTRCQMAALESLPHNFNTSSNNSALDSPVFGSESSSSQRAPSPSSVFESSAYPPSPSRPIRHKRNSSTSTFRVFPPNQQSQRLSSSPDNRAPSSVGSNSSSPRLPPSSESEKRSPLRFPMHTKPTAQPNAFALHTGAVRLSTPELLYPGNPRTNHMYSHGRALSADKFIPISRDTLSPAGFTFETSRHGHSLSADRIMPPLPESTALKSRHTRAMSAEKFMSSPSPPPRSPARTLSLSILTGSKGSGQQVLRKRISKLRPANATEEKQLPFISLPFNFHHHGSVSDADEAVQPI